MRTIRHLLPLICLALAAPAAHATEVYVGPAASYGLAVPAGAGSGNARADSVASLTYIYFDGAYTASTAQSIVLNQVNLASQSAGTITPFLAQYLGGATNNGANYKLLVTGDSFSVPAGGSTGVLVNAAFTVSGINPTISLTAGEIVVAGLYQSSTNVVFTTSASQSLIDTGNVIPAAAGSIFQSGANFYFTNQLYRYDIGFSTGSGAAPEPAPLAVLATGLVGLAWVSRRRRTAATAGRWN